MTDTEAPLLPLPEPIELVWPEMHSHALGCGVEDRGIRDRYEAAEYGWQDGVDKAASCVPEQVYDATQMCEYARACVLADRASRVSQQPALVEQLAQQWDGCMYETLGGAIDIGACIRDAGRRLSGDSVVPPVQPSGATLSQGVGSQWISVDERLPEIDYSKASYERRVTCLVTTEAGWVAEMVYESNGGAKTERGRAPRWIWQGRVSPWRIIAWQPLPAPYMPQVEPGASAERSSEREAG